MSRIRLLPTLFFLFSALVVLFGGWFVYRDYGLIRPLKQDLTSTKQVTDVTVKLDGRNKTIEVAINRVPDLQIAYRSIKTKVSETIDPNATIKLSDKRTPELEAILQQYQPLIYEGIAKGSFTDMIQKVQERGAKDGLSRTLITMDRENLYIQLEKGDHYLYQVVPYHIDKPFTSDQGVSSV